MHGMNTLLAAKRRAEMLFHQANASPHSRIAVALAILCNNEEVERTQQISRNVSRILEAQNDKAEMSLMLLGQLMTGA